jgi:hypothetical protein
MFTTKDWFPEIPRKPREWNLDPQIPKEWKIAIPWIPEDLLKGIGNKTIIFCDFVLQWQLLWYITSSILLLKLLSRAF